LGEPAHLLDQVAHRAAVRDEAFSHDGVGVL
jgi:hypothetical protein